ncbi:MAG: hypothetical protein AAFU79_13365 [Myxococcota bacterium]
MLARGQLAKQLGGLTPLRPVSEDARGPQVRPEVPNHLLLRPSEAPVTLRRRLSRHERGASVLEADAAELRDTGEVIIDGSGPRFPARPGAPRARTGPKTRAAEEEFATLVDEMTETLRELRSLARRDPRAAEALLGAHPDFAGRLRRALVTAR